MRGYIYKLYYAAGVIGENCYTVPIAEFFYYGQHRIFTNFD